jgi:hypothetical protein
MDGWDSEEETGATSAVESEKAASTAKEGEQK